MFKKQLSTNDSALTQVEEIIAEKRRDANSSGQHYRQTVVLMQAYAFLELPVALSTYDHQSASKVQNNGVTNFSAQLLGSSFYERSSRNGTQE